MANAKEIRTQIKSIQNTKKITKAMEMVAASKKRKAQDHMEEARPYAEKIREVAAGLARSNSDIKHAFLTHREVKTVGYIVVTSDRGLCGGLNINLFKALLKDMQTQVEAGRKVVVSVFGSKGHKYLANLGVEILASQEHLGDLPKMQDLLGVITTTVQAFEDGEIDQVFLISNDFINTMVQKPTLEQLLPVPDEFSSATQTYQWDYVYDSDPSELFKTLLIRYIEALIKRSVAENIACEMAARMIAMKSASDNASNLIAEKQLEYNKARQASITQELSEIVAGAAAV